MNSEGLPNELMRDRAMARHAAWSPGALARRFKRPADAAGLAACPERVVPRADAGFISKTRSVDAADIGHLCPRCEAVSGVRLATEARYIGEAPR